MPKHHCEYFIERFEDNSELWRYQDNRGYPKFKLCYLDEMDDPTLDEMGRKCVTDIYERYIKDLVGTHVPRRLEISSPKIKKYDKGSDDRYDKHVDIDNKSNCHRAVAFLLYLNDVKKGGNTVFDFIRSVEPKQGRMIVFPPNWLYQHRGLKAVSNNKYIMSAYGLYK